MTTPNVSGTATWLPTGYGIIADALLNVGAIDENDLGNVPGPMYQSALNKLNGMTKAWITTGIHVWTEEEAILFLQPLQPMYLLGGATTAKCCDAFSYQQTATTLTAGAGASAVNVQSSVGILVGENVGVVLDSGLTFWTTAAAVTGNTVSLTDALPTNASNGAFVFAFPPSAQIIRPLKVPKTRTLQWIGLTETPDTGPLSRQEYMDQPQKMTPGVPNQVFYNPGRDQGQFFVWNNPAGWQYAKRFTWYRPIYDWTSPLSTQDFPIEWAAALTWNLSRELEVGYGVPLATSAKIKELALQYLDAALGWDREPQDVQFGLDMQFGMQD